MAAVREPRVGMSGAQDQGVVEGEPVGGDGGSWFGEGEVAGAGLGVECVFDFVFVEGAGVGCGGLGPEVAWCVGSAELQGDEVIDLVLTGFVGGDAVGAVDGPLFPGGDLT